MSDGPTGGKPVLWVPITELNLNYFFLAFLDVYYHNINTYVTQKDTDNNI